MSDEILDAIISEVKGYEEAIRYGDCTEYAVEQKRQDVIFNAVYKIINKYKTVIEPVE